MDAMRGIITVNGASNYAVSDSEAWSQIACPKCRNPHMLVVARQEPSISDDLHRHGIATPGIELIEGGGHVTNRWLLCVACSTAAVADIFDQVSPPPMEYPTPDGTPKAEARIWEEVRQCLSIHAYNAVAMLCRKLLLHLVFTHERSQNPQATPRNIRFAQAVQYLVDNGVITPAYERLATDIKDIGNRANHELPEITGGEARKIVSFTNYLFVSVYEMPQKASVPTDFVGPAAEPYEGDLEPDASDESS